VSLFIMGSVSFAQDNSSSKMNTGKKAVKPSATVPDKAGARSQKANSSSVHATDAAPAKSTGKMKKDGTPDMRYKENKQNAKPVGKMKKDGTPDMRYKENKQAAPKK